MNNVIVLGGNGMLGMGVLQAFSGSEFNVWQSTRSGSAVITSNVDSVIKFDAELDDVNEALKQIPRESWIINCIGIIKPYIKDSDSDQVSRAIRVNSLFPHRLNKLAKDRDFNILQIATDCVYSGLKGNYRESDNFDAFDVYGKTKSLGEVNSSRLMNIRVSIIGPEYGRRSSLLEWVRNQHTGAVVNGFTNHEWNGISTYAFGKICRGIIEKELFRAGTQHLVPKDKVSKFTLLQQIAHRYSREDLQILEAEAEFSINRTLETDDMEFNTACWLGAGYAQIPTISQIVQEIPDISY